MEVRKFFQILKIETCSLLRYKATTYFRCPLNHSASETVNFLRKSILEGDVVIEEIKLCPFSIQFSDSYYPATEFTDSGVVFPLMSVETIQQSSTKGTFCSSSKHLHPRSVTPHSPTGFKGNLCVLQSMGFTNDPVPDFRLPKRAQQFIQACILGWPWCGCSRRWSISEMLGAGHNALEPSVPQSGYWEMEVRLLPSQLQRV